MATIDRDLPGPIAFEKNRTSPASLVSLSIASGGHRRVHGSAPHEKVHHTDHHLDGQSVAWIDEAVQTASACRGKVD